MGGCQVENCERLPFPLVVCPCCGEGIRFFRGVRIFQPDKLFAADHEPICDPKVPGHVHSLCRTCAPPENEEHFIMWVGEKHYPTPSAFVGEAMGMGISKRINSIPRGFELGKTIVYLAHKKAIWKSLDEQEAGIFGSFVPKWIDGVIDNPDEIPEKAVSLAEKLGDGFRIVHIEKDQAEIDLEGGDNGE